MFFIYLNISFLMHTIFSVYSTFLKKPLNQHWIISALVPVLCLHFQSFKLTILPQDMDIFVS